MVAQKGQSNWFVQNTNQFPKTQISLPKHRSIYQINTNQFSETQISVPKHKSISQNANQFYFVKHKSKDWAHAL